MSDVIEGIEEILDGMSDVGDLVHRLVDEIKRLRASTINAQVTEFHKAFEQDIGEKPAVPSDDVVRLRVSLIMEEAFEAFEAFHQLGENGGEFAFGDALGKVGGDVGEDVDTDQIGEAKKRVQELIKALVPSMNLVEFVDACQDLDYVVEGARLTCGVNGEPCAAEVHRSNLSKLGADGKPVIRADGKRLKGPNYSPPDLASVLKLQGWEG